MRDDGFDEYVLGGELGIFPQSSSDNRIPAPTSYDSASVKPSSANLLAEYIDVVGCAQNPAPELTLITPPPWLARKWGRMARVTSIRPAQKG